MPRAAKIQRAQSGYKTDKKHLHSFDEIRDAKLPTDPLTKVFCYPVQVPRVTWQRVGTYPIELTHAPRLQLPVRSPELYSKGIEKGAVRATKIPYRYPTPESIACQMQLAAATTLGTRVSSAL